MPIPSSSTPRTFAVCLLTMMLGRIAVANEPVASPAVVSLDRQDGRWFFRGPSSEPFVALGINHLSAARAVTLTSGTANAFDWGDYWTGTLRDQLADWNATVLGYDAPAELRPRGLWFATIGTALIEKHRSSPDPASPNAYRFPDVFDPAWQAEATRRIVRRAAATKDDPNLVGTFWVDTPTWDLRKTRALRGTDWVTAIRSLPSDAPGRIAYAAFIADRHAGRLADFNERYGLDLTTLDEVATAPLDMVAIGRHRVFEDDQAFLGTIAETYYRVVGSAQRRGDPNHLIFGDRYLAGDAPDAVLMAAAPWIDAVAVQPGDRYSTLYPPSTRYPADEIDRMHRLTGKPVLVCHHAISYPTADVPRTIFEQRSSEAEAAAATADFLDAAFARPYVVGYLRCQYIDRPARFGRGLRQGLLREDGTPRPKLIEAYRTGFAAARRSLDERLAP